MSEFTGSIGIGLVGETPKDPIHPSDIYSELQALIERIDVPSGLLAVAHKVSRIVLPPPQVWGLLAAAKLARVFLEKHKQKLELLIAYLDSYPLARERQWYSKQAYSMFGSFERFGTDVCRDTVLRVLEHYFAGKWAGGDRPSESLYYQHVIAVRDTLDAVQHDILLSRERLPQKEFLVSVIERFSRSHDPLILAGNVRRGMPKKIPIALEILQGYRNCGDRKRSVQNKGGDRERVRSGRDTLVSRALLDSEEHRAESRMTADDSGLFMQSGLDSSAPRKDRSSRDKDLLEGFAARNVRSSADMASLSLITYVDFFQYVQQLADSRIFALVWLSGVAGINVDRPMVVARDNRSKPDGDQVLISPVVLRFYIARWRGVSDPDIFESAGLMWLPVPERVRAGLLELVNASEPTKFSELVAAQGRRFIRKRAGLAPTAPRLRASAWRHLGKFGQSELETAAISGRVPPSLTAKSHYYPTPINAAVRRFAKAYERMKTELEIYLDDPLVIPNYVSKRSVHAQPMGSLEKLTELITGLSNLYGRGIEALERQCELSLLLRTVNVGQAAVYMLQEFGAGLRPTARVAGLSAALDFGAMTYDKGSRLFSERSYTPLSDRHAEALMVARWNREAVTRVLELCGVAQKVSSDTGDLACFYRWDGGAVKRKRITGSDALEYVSSLLSTEGVPQAYNWRRHSYVEALHNKVPAVLIDEMVGHRRVGREAMSIFSTVGIREFDGARVVLEDLHSELVPDTLLKRVADVERLWMLR